MRTHEEFDRIMRDVAEILEQMEHAEVRQIPQSQKTRYVDGRKVDEIRPLDAVVDTAPVLRFQSLHSWRQKAQGPFSLDFGANG